MPSEGTGAVPGTGRRIAGVLLDWLLSLAITLGLLGLDPTGASGAALVVFAVLTIVFLVLFGTTPGKRIAGFGVAMAGDRALPWPVAMLVRTLLLCLFVPALISDDDQRGLHDRAAGTVTRRF